ncbi:ABC transporter ATP-binding protein [Paenibacillus montaniterrae]|uniref:ABC transporter ATP-binding protein n=1 Tax=Paenibacillus montaniterrae TaxID=429341 RepID=A0A919YTE4_9BACL|nr:ABC transporter ATP-binding protein [Paenibacillus montaniterrae]GIP16533.1 ABC transporter ATP-binding protein [Paenibacillus montaniterrae]
MELTIHHLSKQYRQITAIHNVSLQLSSGIYGLLGPNGAGKSTLIKIITANLQATSGTVSWNGQNIAAMGDHYRSLLGYMPQQQELYSDFTGNRFLRYMAALKGLEKKEAEERIAHLVEVVNLQEVIHKKISAYSGGMKQRLLIAQALLNDPKVIILDEPTAGLDPKERINIRNFISTIAANKIVLIATHVVQDIEYIAKEIIVMKKGEILLKGHPEQLLSSIKQKVALLQLDDEQALASLQQKLIISSIIRDYEQKLHVRVIADDLANLFESASFIEPAYQYVQPTLEDLYLYYFH